MTRIKLLIIALLIVGLSACGVSSRNLGGTWVKGPKPNTSVWCVAGDSGGITCDWEGYHKANP